MPTADTVEQAEARRKLRRRIRFQLAAKFGSTVLLFAGALLTTLLPIHSIGLLMLFCGFVLRVGLALNENSTRKETAKLSYVASGKEQWWFNRKTGEVEEGPVLGGLHLDGPYSSREDAMRSVEIARERAAAWNAEDD